MDGIKNKIEHKYLHGVNLMSNLSIKHKKSTDEGDISLNRQGMLHEVDSIEPLKIPADIYHSFNSAALRAGHARHKSMARDSQSLLRTLQ